MRVYHGSAVIGVEIGGAVKTELALAVGISVMASYLLSRTIIPTLVHFLLRSEVEQHGEATSFFGRSREKA